MVTHDPKAAEHARHTLHLDEIEATFEETVAGLATQYAS